MDITGSPPLGRSNDPLLVAMLVALALHAFLILGVSFDINREQPPAPERTLDITLVQPKPDPEPVEEPEFLAQQTQAGGGEETIKERRTSPLGNPEAAPNPKPALELERSGSEQPEPQPAPEIIAAPTAPREEAAPPPRPINMAGPPSTIRLAPSGI